MFLPASQQRNKNIHKHKETKKMTKIYDTSQEAVETVLSLKIKCAADKTREGKNHITR